MLTLNPPVLLAVLLALVLSLSAAAQPDGSHRSQPFSLDWQFHKGPLEPNTVESLDAAEWLPVHLPHDWAIEGPFDQTLSGEQAKLPWKTEGWYRRALRVEASDIAAGRRTILLFDGVMSNPRVFVNGEAAGFWRYGYNSFWLDLTPFVRAGDNDLAVHVSNLAHESRWYPGAGIYRKVTRLLLEPVHIPVWGVFISTPEVSEDAATIEAVTEVTNTTDGPRRISVITTIIAPGGSEVAVLSTDGVELASGETSAVRQRVRISSPSLWDVDHPHLYHARTSLLVEGQPADLVTTRFGIRTFEWTADDGFHLNGRRVQLLGVCQHHDNGPLGAVSLPDAERRKLRILKDMGVNAVRTSHNAPAPELLEICDEMGLLVIDELFDKWGPTASSDVTTAEFVERLAEDEVRNFIRRDRNHPSIVLWSIGNEIGDVLTNRDGRGPEHVRRMVEYFRKHDTTRPTNMAMHIVASADNGVLDAVDTQGWNYGAKYLRARERYPSVPQIYTESASAFSTRGHYVFPHPTGPHDFADDHAESSYDRTSARWSDIPDHEFLRMERHTYNAGEFVWTGFDYLGEPTPHTQQARSSYFGIIDLVGLPKDRYFLYRSLWNRSDETLHILPHWTWPDRVGQNVPVYIYTSGDEAELFLNGRSLGRRSKAKPSADLADARNLAFNRPASASSEEIQQDATGNVKAEYRADKAVDGLPETRWCAAGPQTPQWLAVDLGRLTPIREVIIDWERDGYEYDYTVETSDDAGRWTPIGGSDTHARMGTRTSVRAEASGRHVRVRITGLRGGSWASIRELRVEAEARDAVETTNPYYDVIDRYRLRWESVTHEPGTLRAVAYRDGRPIAETEVQTAGPAAGLRLTPERTTIAADGMSLAYVLVQTIDAEGRVNPRDMRMVRFRVEGPATIAGIGNGDPMGYDPFVDAQHPLLYGHAVVILRSLPGSTAAPGTSDRIILHAEADGLEPTQAVVNVTPR